MPITTNMRILAGAGCLFQLQFPGPFRVVYSFQLIFGMRPIPHLNGTSNLFLEITNLSDFRRWTLPQRRSLGLLSAGYRLVHRVWSGASASSHDHLLHGKVARLSSWGPLAQTELHGHETPPSASAVVGICRHITCQTRASWRTAFSTSFSIRFCEHCSSWWVLSWARSGCSGRSSQNALKGHTSASPWAAQRKQY